MNPENPQEMSLDKGSGRTLVINATIMYGAMAAIGAMVCYYRHGSLVRSLHMNAELIILFRLLAVACLGAGVLLVSNFLFEELFPSYRNLKWALARLMGGFSVPTAVYLALSSALGEELLFRGAIQAEVGIIITSVIFGMLHLGPGGQVSSWTVWTAMAGLLLGWMYQATGNLWAPILSHFIVNLVGFLRLRGLHRAAKLAMDRSPTPQVPENSTHL
jgi:hypothetical protein